MPGEPSGCLVRSIVEFLDGKVDSRLGRRTNVRLAVDDARNRLNGNAGQVGYIEYS